MGNSFLWPLLVVQAIAAVGFAVKGNIPMAWVWTCYTLSVLGFMGVK